MLFINKSEKLLNEMQNLDKQGYLYKSVPAEPIFTFLNKELLMNEDLFKKVEDPKRNFKSCLEFVLHSVKELCTGQSCWVNDEDVYDLAVKYYTTDTNVLNKTLNEKTDENIHTPKENSTSSTNIDTTELSLF